MKEDTPTQDERQCKSILSLRTQGRQVPDFDALNKDDIHRLERRNKGPERLKEMERVIQRLIEVERQNGGTLRGTGARKTAARQFGVSIWTIDNWMERYKADPRIESLIDKKRGRTPGGTFTLEQQQIIAYFSLNPKKQVIGDDTGTAIVDGLENVAYIQEILKMFTPAPPHSDDAVRRFMRNLKRDNPVTAVLARNGKKYVESKMLPARRNDVKLPGQRSQIDGRPLPIYIRHDGVICTVTLLLIMDDYSQYPIRARLIPRILRDEKGHPNRCDFNAADVGITFASALYYSGRGIDTLYNDHGSQIIKLEEFLADLSEENQAAARMAKSIRGRPRGRGKIENLLKKIDELLMDQPGNIVGKEKDFDAIREARARPDLLNLETLQKKVDAFMEKLRDEPRRQGETKTRRELWEQPEGASKAPPIRRLMVLVPEKVSRDTAIDYWGFEFNNQEYEPRVKSEEDLYRWMVAALRREFIPLRAALLDAGWEVEICLDREDGYWCEGVLKTEQYLTKEQYAPMIGRVLARVGREHTDKLDELRERMKTIGVDKAYKHDISKHPVVLSERPSGNQATQAVLVGREAPSAPVAVSKDQADSSATKSDRRSSVSVRTAPPRKPEEQVGRKLDWSKAPKSKDLLEQIEREMQRKEDSA